MFDWNVDQELTNIIWGEAGESDDHIVPYPEQEGEKPHALFGDSTKKETNHESTNAFPVEQKKPPVNSDHGVKLDSPKYDPGDPATGFGLSLWSDEPKVSLSDDAKAEQDSMGNSASNNITKNSKNGLLGDETAQFDKNSEVFPDPPEDGEQAVLDDYGWANIGSFDDLDRIFSNNDPIFGDVTVGNTDELWTSSKDTLEMDAIVHACHSQLGDGTAATPSEFPEKGNNLNRFLKGQKLEKKSEVTQLHDLCGAWSSSGSPVQQLNNQYGPSMVNPCAPLVLTRPEPMQQNQFAVPLLASPVYGNMVNYYPAPSVMAHSSGYAVPPGNANSLRKPPSMTPKEKIEKLRRRQQMRAILAIQKQQQQFGNQANMDGGKVEADQNLSSIPSLDTSSHIEHDDSNTSSVPFDQCSVEESVLSRLQNTIAKLDIQMRLCIRDSLYRLAHSAMQRQYSSSTSSTNATSRDEIPANKDIDIERLTRMPDVETDTNPIDRTVAHLLFHRPLEFYEKPSETPQSSILANLSCEKKAKGIFHDDFENTQITSPQGSKTLRVFSNADQSRNSPRLDTPDNASNNEASDGGLKKAEASK